MAPFAPTFGRSEMYQSLPKKSACGEVRSSLQLSDTERIHDSNAPRSKPSPECKASEFLLGRQKRNPGQSKNPGFPLANLTVIHEDQALLDEVKRLSITHSQQS